MSDQARWRQAIAQMQALNTQRLIWLMGDPETIDFAAIDDLTTRIARLQTTVIRERVEAAVGSRHPGAEGA